MGKEEMSEYEEALKRAGKIIKEGRDAEIERLQRECFSLGATPEDMELLGLMDLRELRLGLMDLRELRRNLKEK